MITRKRVAIALGALALLALSFCAGRYTTPVRVETKERVVTQTQVVEKIVNRDVIQTQVVHDVVTAKNVVTKLVWVKAPDGTVTTTETETDRTKTDDHTNQATQHVSDHIAESTTVIKVDATKNTITSYTRPAWSVAVMPGLDVRGLASDGLAGLSGATLVKRGVLGASVEHRFAGPLFLGAWGNTAGAGGLSVRLEF